MKVQYEQAMGDWVSAIKPWDCKGSLWNKGVLMEDKQEKGRKKTEFPWLFSESGAQHAHCHSKRNVTQTWQNIGTQYLTELTAMIVNSPASYMYPGCDESQRILNWLMESQTCSQVQKKYVLSESN